MRQTILLVDDDPQIRAICRTTLEESGYVVGDASNGKQALAAIKKAVYDLIVLDLCMPEVDGFEFLKAVRHKAPKLKIIVISGLPGGAMLTSSKYLGGNATLAKPFSPDSLLLVVDEVLRTEDSAVGSD